MKAPTASAALRSRVPDFATAAAGLTHPHLDASPQFVWIFHPRRFAVLAGRLVPALSTLQLVAGVNNVSFNRDGRPNIAAVRTKLEQEGRRMIPWEWAPDGESYLNVVETKPGGGAETAEAWMSVFEVAHLGASTTETDSDAYSAWLAELVTAGKLPPCPLDVAASLLTRAKRRHAVALQTLARSGGAGTHSFRADALKREIEVLEEYIAAARKAAKPAKPKAGGRRVVEADEGAGE